MAARKTSEELREIYRRSLENMRDWLRDSTLRPDERVGVVDAWQEDLRAFFRDHGHCFSCERPFDHCVCSEPLEGSVH